MRIRTLAELLARSVEGAPEPERRARITAFLRALSRARKWKLLPRIVATLERFETEAGRPPLELRVPDRTVGPTPATATLVEDATLIAGARARSGDSMVDTSLRTQLTRLAQALKS